MEYFKSVSAVNIKLKSLEKSNFYRIENKTTLQEIIINEDLFNPQTESIALGFRNDTSSGIIELSAAEFENIFDEVKSKIHLIKGFKRLSASGAIRLK